MSRLCVVLNLFFNDGPRRLWLPGTAVPAVNEGSPWSTSRLVKIIAASKVGESKDREEISPTNDDDNHEKIENFPPTSDDNNHEDAEKKPVANDDNNAEKTPSMSDCTNDTRNPPPITYVGYENSQALMDIFGLTVSATTAVLKPLADKSLQVTICRKVPFFHWLHDMRA